MTMTVSTEVAEDIIYGDHHSQLVSEHRWYDKQLIVFDHEDGLMGFYYLKPKTELQEGQDVFEADPVPIFPVLAKEVMSTVYEAVDA